MKRDLMTQLIAWRSHPIRMPLILRGARQVGKSWLVKEFGKQFSSYIEINFDKDVSAKNIFSDDINVKKLLDKLSLYAGKKIIPGETLLFLDEAQECENSLKTLRYFKEELPELHVIAAGSLIDFALQKIGVPVGRVQQLYLKPLSFGEFLTVSGDKYLRQALLDGNVDISIHEKLNELIKSYFWLGGMPAVIDSWLEFKDPTICQKLQDLILHSYIQDFEKYAKKQQIDHVVKVFHAVPEHLGNKFKASKIDSEVKSVQLKSALDLLVKAGVVYKCFHTSSQGAPLAMGKDYDKFKTYFFDTGLAMRLLKINLRQWITTPLNINFIGSIAEQFVAQELVAYSDPDATEELYYWHRESKSSNAAIDFLTVNHDQIVPIEVKASVKGGMKSLALFLDSHIDSKYGLKISERYYSKHGKLVEIPFYGIESWMK